MQINKEEDRIRLMEMADSIREIEAYVGRGGYADFADREDMRQAISAHLQQIGTAASLLSDEFKETYGGIKWTTIRQF